MILIQLISNTIGCPQPKQNCILYSKCTLMFTLEYYTLYNITLYIILYDFFWGHDMYYMSNVLLFAASRVSQ